MNLSNCTTLGSVINNRSTICNNKKSKVYQMVLTDIFAWGQILANKLEDLVEIETEANKNFYLHVPNENFIFESKIII